MRIDGLFNPVLVIGMLICSLSVPLAIISTGIFGDGLSVIVFTLGGMMICWGVWYE